MSGAGGAGGAGLSCDAPLLDCDQRVETGCETDVRGNPAHCGSCDKVCSNANGSQSCADDGGTWVCQPTCNLGFDDCDDNPDNGCETSLNTVANCGSCGDVCANANGTTRCDTSGQCAPVCDLGFDDCNNDLGDGCETNVTRAMNHCGTCGTVCTNDNGTTSCVAGACAPVCAGDFADCNGDPNDGCELNPLADDNSCQTAVGTFGQRGDLNCGTACPATGETTFFNDTGTGNRFFRLEQRENSDCNADLQHVIELSYPVGVNYDIYVWEDDCGNVFDEGPDNTKEKTTTETLRAGDGGTEEVILTTNEGNWSVSPGIPPSINDPDNDVHYRIEVRFVSGDPCLPWTLLVRGRNC